jgi:hypothetical protein
MNRPTSVFVLISCLWLLGIWTAGIQSSVQATPVERTAESAVPAADSLLLDQFPDAYAAYSLAQQRSDYEGPLLRVRRGSDGAEQDFGFDSNGILDVSGIESWLSGADGYVTTWYNQQSGEPDLSQSSNGDQPKIAEGGTVTTNGNGKVAIDFSGGYLTASGLTQIAIENHFLYVVGQITTDLARQTIWDLDGGPRLRNWDTEDAVVLEDGVTDANSWFDLTLEPAFWAANYEGSSLDFYEYNAGLGHRGGSIESSATSSTVAVGAEGGGGDGFDGYISEIGILSSGLSTEDDVFDAYDIANARWSLGPQGYHRDALLPQQYPWQIDLYDWLETITLDDVDLPDGTLQYDNSLSDPDKLADLWYQVEGLSASSVTRAEPMWYVLDDGDGNGIEGTGKVRANHNPEGPGGYGGNPPRSWQNEPAYWYQLDIPLSGDGQGNPWYQNDAMGLRAMIVSTVDLMMHVEQGGSQNWFDMEGKAFLAIAESYRYAKGVMPQSVQEAYLEGVHHILDNLISRGPRGANTNMDMFAIRGAGELWAGTDDEQIQDKCVKLVKRSLFGSVDGALETDHEVFARQGDKGVLSPSGYIMEGGQPDVFYSGDSANHLAGLLAAVQDRDTGDLPSEWQFLDEVMRRVAEWRAYTRFYETARISATPNKEGVFSYGPGGFNGRTAHYSPSSQGNQFNRSLVVGERYDEFFYKGSAPSVSSMESDISGTLSTFNSRMDSYYQHTPDVWSGWSPWAKRTHHLPPKGWWSYFQNNPDGNQTTFPLSRNDTYNKTLGGPPMGTEYWIYKDTDDNGETFAFLVESHERQGQYGGWFGGKIEAFWQENGAHILLNRHGKTGGRDGSGGCSGGNEDSMCWSNIDEKAAHHVWGRADNGDAFTTLYLHDRSGTAHDVTDNTDQNPPSITVLNKFNTGSAQDNAIQNNTLTGNFQVENKIEATANGAKVTHTITSDQSDDISELWGTLPVFLRDGQDPAEHGGEMLQRYAKDTKIEYWDGSQWAELPENEPHGPGIPATVTTQYLRLERDFEDWGGINHSYVEFESSQDVRRSERIYQDPYQTHTRSRSVHIDLHGDPGTTKTMPDGKSVTYTIRSTDPTSEDTSTSQTIPLQNGWNIASTSVSPATPAMNSVFAGLESEITVVENEAGERYRPGEDTNEIGEWNSEEAYRIHAKSDVTLTIQGDSLETPSIALDEGWNLVPYFPSSALPVEEALSPIIEDLGRVKDEAGQVYLPDHDPDVLEQMEPGEGYKVYVRQSTTLTYPDGAN